MGGEVFIKNMVLTLDLKLFLKIGLRCFIIGILVNVKVIIILQIMILNFFILHCLKKMVIFCYIVYRNCFFDFISLCIKSGIAFYLITYFIYIVFFIKKNIRITSRFIINIPKNLIPILLIININQFLNIIFNSKKKW